MRIAVDPSEGVVVEGDEQELTNLASALLEAAVLGEVQEPVLLTDQGVATIRIRRTDQQEDLDGEA